jgi:hypothetical protein
LRGDNCIPASGGPIGRGPVAVGETAVFAGDLDHAVQRDVFDDFELFDLSLRVLGLEFLLCCIARNSRTSTDAGQATTALRSHDTASSLCGFGFRFRVTR